MKTRVLMVTILLVVLVSAPSFGQTSLPQVPAAAELAHPPQPKPLSPFAQELMQTQRALLDAVHRGDKAYVQNAVADDFRVISTNGDTGTKAELVEYVRPAKHEGAQPIVYDFDVVPLSDGAGVVTFKIAEPGGYERYQHISNTWVKEGGQWKLKFEQVTLNLWSAHDL
jgi:hypothetical protein